MALHGTWPFVHIGCTSTTEANKEATTTETTDAVEWTKTTQVNSNAEVVTPLLTQTTEKVTTLLPFTTTNDPMSKNCLDYCKRYEEDDFKMCSLSCKLELL